MMMTMNKWLIEKELRKQEKDRRSKLLMKKKLKSHRPPTTKGKSNKPFYKVKK